MHTPESGSHDDLDDPLLRLHWLEETGQQPTDAHKRRLAIEGVLRAAAQALLEEAVPDRHGLSEEQITWYLHGRETCLFDVEEGEMDEEAITAALLASLAAQGIDAGRATGGSHDPDTEADVDLAGGPIGPDASHDSGMGGVILRNASLEPALFASDDTGVP